MLHANPGLALDWITVLEEFQESSEDIINSIPTWGMGVARFAHRLLTPRSRKYQEELKGLSQYLSIDMKTLMAGQLVYDASTVGTIDARCGCTSMAKMHNGKPWHGRLLDWNWPESINGRIHKIKVRTKTGQDFYAEHIPGAIGFTGAFNSRFAANLNQAPVSSLRVTSLPALWWFRANIEDGTFLRSSYAPPGGMTDALVHVTHRSGRTSRIYYTDGVPEIYSEKLGSTPVILTNTYDSEDVEEDPDMYAWCKWREDAILNSNSRSPRKVLGEALCDDTVFQWDTKLG